MRSPSARVLLLLGPIAAVAVVLLHSAWALESLQESVAFTPSGLRATPAQLQEHVGRTQQAIFICGGLVLVGAAAFSWWLILRMVRPVEDLTIAAEGLGRGRLRVRVPVAGDDEFARLASTFNAMAARIEGSLDEVRSQVDAAEEAGRAKATFLAMMSHEVRTPLSAILGFNEVLLDEELAPEQRQLVESVQRSSRDLLNLVNELLDLSRIEAGGLEILAFEFHLASVLERTLDSLRPGAEAKDLVLELEVDPEIPNVVQGDAGRLRQILLNFVGNAIKFTEAGRIDVEARLIETSASGSRVRVSVTDTGVGIEPDDLERIFEPFAQVDPYSTRRHGGAGLGLAICRELAGLLGGSCGAESRPAIGSTFWVELPLREPLPGDGDYSRSGQDRRLSDRRGYWDESRHRSAS